MEEMEKMIELKYKGVTKSVDFEKYCVLLFVAEKANKNISVMITEDEYSLITFSNKDKKPSGAISMLLCALTNNGVEITSIALSGVENGKHVADVTFRNADGEQTLKCDFVDAVALSHHGHIPIMVTPSVLNKLSSRTNGQAVAMPICSVSVEVLETVLQKAIEEENFEFASIVRDEIESRK